jgi:subtilase family serine protease
MVKRWTTVLLALVLTLTLLPLAALAAPPGSPPGLAIAAAHVCAAGPPGQANCHALVWVDANGRPSATAGPAGFGPADLHSAYNLPYSLPSNTVPTVAIVDAFDNPNAEKDLGVYRAQYNLPPCTTANGCFRKVDQRGGTSYPQGDTGWGEEIALDLDMVSAICPNCHILLVEADSNSLTNLGTAVNQAASMGAHAISNSYGAREFPSEAIYESSYYNHPGIAVTVSSGDSGYGVEFPAASQYVTAVGGTSLRTASNARGWTETVWSGAGSGCSAYVPKPSWQTDTGCNRRTVADVSAVADPNTGVAVYDTYGVGGWLVFGGTSVSAPIIAGVYALAGNASSVNYGSYSYSHKTSLFDITSGSNGSCGGRGKKNSGATYLCTGGTGYDGPSGNGTPNGIGGF